METGTHGFRLFHVARRRVGLAEDGPELSTAAFRRSEETQLGLGLCVLELRRP
jgi:hypothetical protein